MIHEEICTYEVAKLAKDKGFPQNGHHKYYEFGGSRLFTPTYKGAWYRNSPIPNTCVAVPTQSLLQRWLREEKGVVVEAIAYPTCSNNKKNCYWWSIKQNSDGICYQYEECSDTLYGFGFAFDTYELALEDALKYALENLVI